jgi:GT2 family glycosyltransferase
MKSNFFIQFFYDISAGFSESDSERIPVKLTSETQEFIFKIPENGKIKNIRIDPINCRTLISISMVSLTSEKDRLDITDRIVGNGIIVPPDMILYLDEDPQIYFNNIDENILRDYNYITIIIRYYQLDVKVATNLTNSITGLEYNLITNCIKSLKPPLLPMLPAKKEDIDVSIIIASGNNWPMMQNCINSVIRSCQKNKKINYEIILAGDCSEGETVNAGTYFPGLRIIRTDKNIGFLRTCNNAAANSRGRYVLFLNSNTIVLPGWLPALFYEAEKDADSAMVGSKVLYSGKTIKEAGSIIFSDGEVLGVGRGLSRSMPIFNTVRETDSTGGYSVLIRKSFWDMTGGFDESYSSFHGRGTCYEYADLAIKSRLNGFKVLYQPLSEVIYLKQNTTGIEKKDIILRNKNILQSKWKPALEKFYVEPGSPWHYAISNADHTAPAVKKNSRLNNNEHKFNVLYFSPVASHPANHGNKATVYSFARRFKQFGHNVHFVLHDRIDQHSFEDSKAMKKAWDTLDALPFFVNTFNQDNIPFDGWYQEGLGEDIRSLCVKYDIDIILCSYIFSSKLLEYVPNYILKIIDTHDKFGNRFEALRERGVPLEFFSCTPEEEGGYLKRADIVIARREEEAEYFNEVSGRKTAIVIPHFEDPKFIYRGFSELRNIGLLASPNFINLRIAVDFIAVINNYINEAACPFIINIAGDIKNLILTQPPDIQQIFYKPYIRLHGFLPNLNEFYSKMDLIVSPITIGTGINVKSVEAMAYGLPLLATKIGSKGIETDEQMHRHDNIEDLVKSLLSLVNKPTELNRLGALSRSIYGKFYEKSLNNFKSIFEHQKLRSNV